MSDKVLVYCDLENDLIFQCDASPYGVGVLLSHRTHKGDQPTVYASRTLCQAEKNIHS